MIQYRLRTEALVQRVASAALPTEHGAFRVVSHSKDTIDGTPVRWGER